MKKRIHIISLTCAMLMVTCGIGSAASENTETEKTLEESAYLPSVFRLLEQYREFPATPPFNDTGITSGGNYPTRSNTGCSGAVIDAQDCRTGRDGTHYWNKDGRAGFSFTKLDANGAPLSYQGNNYNITPWSCVKDNVTGLIWEVKTDGGGLHNADHQFTWYNTDPATNGLGEGEPNPEENTCYGYTKNNPATFCNTEAYVKRVNAQGLCGANNWRMPTLTELISIQSLHQYTPTIDTGFFPNQSDEWVWSGTPSAHGNNSNTDAWMVDYSFGHVFKTLRTADGTVRLVRDP